MHRFMHPSPWSPSMKQAASILFIESQHWRSKWTLGNHIFVRKARIQMFRAAGNLQTTVDHTTVRDMFIFNCSGWTKAKSCICLSHSSASRVFVPCSILHGLRFQISWEKRLSNIYAKWAWKIAWTFKAQGAEVWYANGWTNFIRV
jgi:hypothetical protein